jgi:hypothetical protein
MDDGLKYPSLFGGRTFEPWDARMSGKSVVVENNSFAVNPLLSGEADPWPYQLSDYLRGYSGRLISVKYQISNDKYCEKTGVLRVVGANFIGMQPLHSDDLLLIDLGAVKSINIGECRGYPSGRYG